jgi:hypothetical protein
MLCSLLIGRVYLLPLPCTIIMQGRNPCLVLILLLNVCCPSQMVLACTCKGLLVAKFVPFFLARDVHTIATVRGKPPSVDPSENFEFLCPHLASDNHSGLLYDWTVPFLFLRVGQKNDLHHSALRRFGRQQNPRFQALFPSHPLLSLATARGAH